MSTYSPPAFLFNGHLETIYPALFRKVKLVSPRSFTIPTPDSDFLELDHYQQNNKQVLLISHGLEGNSKRAYVTGLAKHALSQHFDVIAWNFRGCGTQLNRQRRLYHSGATDDLATLVAYTRTLGYDSIYLSGFSLGGNLTLKYLGENPVPNNGIDGAVVFSVPLHLSSSCQKIAAPENILYSNRFLKSLKSRIKWKASQYPDIDISQIDTIKDLKAFDNTYTAPLHGFDGAEDYYSKCSAVFFLDSITTPTLILNALNDPFLSEACYPVEQVKSSKFVQLETPARGGHVGFATIGKNGVYWSEWRALEFLRTLTHD